jgi:hypothetical protein
MVIQTWIWIRITINLDPDSNSVKMDPDSDSVNMGPQHY